MRSRMSPVEFLEQLRETPPRTKAKKVLLREGEELGYYPESLPGVGIEHDTSVVYQERRWIFKGRTGVDGRDALLYDPKTKEHISLNPTVFKRSVRADSATEHVD